MFYNPFIPSAPRTIQFQNLQFTFFQSVRTIFSSQKINYYSEPRRNIIYCLQRSQHSD